MEEVTVIGGGGHAKVLIDCIEEENKYKINFVIDDNPELHQLFEYPIYRLFHFKTLSNPKSIIAIGNCKVRKTISEKIDSVFITAIHPKAVISKYATIGNGSQVFAGCIVNAGASIGKHCIINTGTIVEHDCVIGDFVHLSPNASIGGGVKIGSGTHIGIGATIIQNIVIGSNVIIGAGAVVVSDIPEDCTAVGIPAKPIKFQKTR